jgi:hypothetical protein
MARNHSYQSPSLTTPVSYSYSDPLLFVGQGSRQTSLILNAKDQVVGHVSAPSGIFETDQDGTLYDAPYHYTNRLLIFAPPYTVAKVLSYRNYGTEAVAIDPKRGVFVVTVTYAGEGGGPSYAYFYRRGGTLPCATVSAPPGSSEFGLGAAFDREGTLFAPVLLGNGNVEFASISGECNATAALINTFPDNQGLYASAKLQFNTNDDLVFGVLSGQVLTFAHPINGEFSNPISTTTFKIPPHEGYPQFRCLSSDGRFLWESYGENIVKTKHFAEFPYPQGGEAVQTLDIYNADACATAPPLIP